MGNCPATHEKRGKLVGLSLFAQAPNGSLLHLNRWPGIRKDCEIRKSRGSKGRVGHSSSQQPHQRLARSCAAHIHRTRQQYFSVGLRDHVDNVIVGPQVGGKRRVEAVVGVEPGQAVARKSIVGGEVAANQKLSVGQPNDGVDFGVISRSRASPGSRIKGGVYRAGGGRGLENLGASTYK